ncbi:MAG TPA: CapA family protein [Marisediminicola sp.]|nr:CapA family protein [Marisediminicola sp.]
MACSIVTMSIVTAMVADFEADSEVDVNPIEYNIRGGYNGWTLQFVGDTMLGDAAQPILDTVGYDAVLTGVAPLLDGDFIVANLEAPVTLRTEPLDVSKTYSYSSRPVAATALRRAGVDAVGLGNNHSMDMGPGGLSDTMRFSAANNILTFGAGPDLAQAERPLILHSRLGTVGIVALGEDFGKATRASVDHAGVVALREDRVQRGIDLARAAGADWVIAYVHWGDNYSGTNFEQRHWADVLVEAGYELIIGTGPHSSSPIEFIKSVPVVYSAGNFAFGAPGRFDAYGKEGIGLAVSLELKRGAPAGLAVRCLITDNDIVNYVPLPCTEPQTRSAMARVSQRLSVEGNTARMPCECFLPHGKDDRSIEE